MGEGSERRPDRSRLPQIRFCPCARPRTKVRKCRLPTRRVFQPGDTDTLEFQFGAQNPLLGSFLKGFGRDDAGEVYVLIDSSMGPSGTGGKVLKITKAKTVM